jgi:hypothetical protein
METIKLAIIGPYSRAGGILRQNLPLADPYSNWIIALGGEFIPLTWLQLKKPFLRIYHDFLAPNFAKLNFAGYVLFSKWLIRNLNKFHNIQYLTKFDVVLVIVHDYAIREMGKFVVTARKMRKRPRLFAVLCVPFEHIRNALKNSENFKYFKILLDSCDAFLNCEHKAISDYLKLYTDTPIITFPMLYPFEFTKTFF